MGSGSIGLADDDIPFTSQKHFIAGSEVAGSEELQATKPLALTAAPRTRLAQRISAFPGRRAVKVFTAAKMLAGDWIANGLPATIEGSIRSGQKAADLLMNPSMNSSVQR